jgi:CheY-like chemotaxis protein
MEVLLVDDEAAVRADYAEWLRAEGHAVECADGPAALMELARKPWDVLIVDMLMPDVDGLEVIMAARALNQPPRIVAMSGDGFRNGWEYLRLADILGADLCLSKPLDRPLLAFAATPSVAA